MYNIITKKHNIKLIEVVAGDKYCEANGEGSYANRSYVAGNDEIFLGIYDDDELKMISFFHELGHCIDDRSWIIDQDLSRVHVYTFEEKAWAIGLKYAKNEYNIEFSKKALDWAKEQLDTYIGWEEREVTGYSAKDYNNEKYDTNVFVTSVDN